MSARRQDAAGDDDVAIVGMSGRLPGGDLGDGTFFAALLEQRTDRVRPLHRSGISDPCIRLATIPGVDAFDAAFFNISPREAEAMDPHQRLLLQCAYNAVEDAGMAPTALAGRRVGVFIGHTASQDGASGEKEAANPYTLSGSSAALTANRISYFLDLRGQSFAVDAACASSLVAIIQAARAVLHGDCEMALAGAANLVLGAHTHDALEKNKMLSPSHRCASFDAAADGYARGEGVVVFVLKRLHHARRDGDSLLGVIKSMACNHGGRGQSLTAPNPQAQADLIEAAHRPLGLATIGYVECHGTGTKLGDPMEVSALADAWRRLGWTPSAEKTALGSVKANIGHLEAAAGAAGLATIVLSMRYRLLPGNPHLTNLNPHIDAATTPFDIVRLSRPWSSARPLRAGLSSFGFGGAGAHIVVEAAAAVDGRAGIFRPLQVVTLSARSLRALNHLRLALVDALDRANLDDSEFTLANVAYTLNCGRAHWECRLAWTVASLPDLRSAAQGTRVVSKLTGSMDTVSQADEPSPQAICAAYLAGQSIDWGNLYDAATHRRLSLPGYQFDAVCFPRQFPQIAWKRVDDGWHVQISAHHPWLRDHIVAGKKILPGAAYLCLLQQAAAKQGHPSAAYTFENVVWRRALVCHQGMANVQLTLTLRLGPQRSDFTACSAAGLHVSGRLLSTTAALLETLPAAAAHSDILQTLGHEQIYDRFAAAGLSYHEAFRALRRLEVGRGHVAGQVHCPIQSVQTPSCQLLDAIFQTTLGLGLDGLSKPLLPFSAGRLVFTDAFYGAARLGVEAVNISPHRVRLNVFDEHGVCVLHVGDLSARPAPPAAHVPTPQRENTMNCRYFIPAWQQAAALQDRLPGAAFVLYDALSEQAAASLVAALGAPSLPLGASDGWQRLCAAAYPQVYILIGHAAASSFDVGASLGQCLMAVQKLAPVANLTLRFVTCQATDSAPGVAVRADGTAVLGFAKTVAREYSHWNVACIDIDAMDRQTCQHIATEANADNPSVSPISLRAGHRWLRVLRETSLVAAMHPPFRVGGHYLIIGGQGGLGGMLAAYLARRYSARLTLIGRAVADANKLAALRAQGGNPTYVPCDVTDSLALSRVLDAVDPIDGIVHSALVLRDSTLGNMDERTLLEVMRPKVEGCLALDQALGARRPDFILYMSSAQSFLGNPGQGNYSAACTFKDGIAAQQRSRGLNARVVNWGYWGSIGVVATPIYRERMGRLGVGSIEESEGLEAVERILAGPDPQVMVLKANDAALEKMHLQLLEPPVTAGAHGLERIVPTCTPNPRQVQAQKALETVTRQRVAQLPAATDVLPTYRRLARAVDAIAQQGGQVCRQLAGQVEAEYPELQAHLALLDRCLAHLPEVMRGAADPVSVLFPQGSLDLVTPIYSGNPVADKFNALVGETVCRYAGSIHARPLHILEIGAGTGSTTAHVLPAVDLRGGRYVYTDLSLRFIRHGERQFGKYAGFAAQILNIEKPCAAADQAQFDIVLATNVLHATRNIAETLRHVAAHLKPAGIAVINEVTQRQDFATVTFGLTPGWWLFADDGTRIPDSPLLSGETWERLLLANGFSACRRCGAEGQQVIVAMRCAATTEVVAPAVPSAPAVAALTPSTRPSVDRAALMHHLRELIGTTMRLDPRALDVDMGFDTYGIDSLITLELTAPLIDMFGYLPATLFFEFPTLAKLAEYLATEHEERARELFALATVPPQRPAPAIPADPARQPEPTGWESDAVAIVGMAARLPQADSLDAFWQNLAAGATAFQAVPTDRWCAQRSTDSAAPGGAYTQVGCFVDDIDMFDHAFFGITPDDAANMDPQQRLALQVAYHAIEDAGYDPSTLRDRDVGAFVGVMNGGYGWLGADPRRQDNGADSLFWAVANRLSYHFDLKGPSMAIDTACSASLTALHQACLSLKAGDCTAALVGGVNLIVHPRQMNKLCGLKMLSPRGRCEPFAASADGFVDGEGVVMLLLKPYTQALADGDRIHVIIRGSAVNAGGRTKGFSVPSPAAQGQVITRALARAKVSPHAISYVEAHGTGTRLGDPIELAGLTKAFHGVPPGTCALGSVKGNIGHLESAAGLVSVVKVALQMRHGLLAPSLNHLPQNPHLNLRDSPFVVQQDLAPWRHPTPGTARCAAVSSFGAGGANAHCILQEPPSLSTASAASQGEERVFALSGRTPAALLRRVAELHRWLADNPDADLYAVGAVLSRGRAHHRHRAAFVATNMQGLTGALLQFYQRLPGGSTPESAAAPLGEQTPDGVAHAYRAGQDVLWEKLYPQRSTLSLPLYPFAKVPHWLPSLPGVVGEDSMAFVADHVVGDNSIVPGAVLLAHVAQALPSGRRVESFTWLRPLSSVRALEVRLQDKAFACFDALGTLVAEGSLSASCATPSAVFPPLLPRCAQQKSRALYDTFAANGATYGPTLRVICDLHGAGEWAWASLAAPPSADALNPGVMDGALQVAAALHLGAKPEMGLLYPYRLGAFDLFTTRLPRRCRIVVRRAANDQTYTAWVTDFEGTVLAIFHSLLFRAPTRRMSEESAPNETTYASLEVLIEAVARRSITPQQAVVHYERLRLQPRESV